MGGPVLLLAEPMSKQAYTLAAEAAEFYESTFVPALFADWAHRLVEAADPAAGQSVLDVGCGTGIVARTAADRLGRAGVVVGMDRNEAMLEVARRLRPELRWVLGDAGALPFRDGSFDLVLSQAALMFFDDRAAALREMGRVAGAHGRVVVQVPGRLAASPGYVPLAEAVKKHAPAEVLDLLHAYFAVGETSLLRRLFNEAGLRIERLDSWLGATRLESVGTFLSVELLPIAGRVSAAVRDRIVADCRPALAGFTETSGAVAAPIEVQLITARRL
jgi:ubiquinone/menaquinone biosynthesis C-methylase UbiE